MKKGALALTIVGGVFVAISLLVIVITVILTATSGGKIDPDESAPVIGGGGCCCFVSVAMLVGGIAWLLVAKSKGE